MENLNLVDNTNDLSIVPVQDAHLEGDSVLQHHEIAEIDDTLSEQSFHNPDERENKRTQPLNGTRYNYNNHRFPNTYHRDDNTKGYCGKTLHGYNGRGPFSRNYHDNYVYPQPRTYHRDNIINSTQSFGHSVHRNHDWIEQRHGRNFMEQSRTNHTNYSFYRNRQPWNDDSQRKPWTNYGQRQPWADDRRGQPWTNAKQQEQPWSNNRENMSHRGSPPVYNRPRSYSLQNGARPYIYQEREKSRGPENVGRPYKFHERGTSNGPQNRARPYRFHERETSYGPQNGGQESGKYRGMEFESNMNNADSVGVKVVSYDMPPRKNDADEKMWATWPVHCEGNVLLKQIEMRSQKQEIEGSSGHDQIPIFRIPSLRKKLLILDVNGLLADVILPPPKEVKADINIYRRAIFKRPFMNDFLKFCFETFDVAIWSSRTKKILDSVVDYLFGDMRCRLLFCWDQSHCTKTGVKTLENQHKELLLKELKKVWEKYEDNLPYDKGYYNESNTLLLDDSPYKALLNPRHSAIFPHTYSYTNTSDNSLGHEGDLRVYLTGLITAENVKKYVEEHPFGQQPIDETNSSWDFYFNVITSQTPEQLQTLEQSQALVQPQTLEQPQTFVQPQVLEQPQTFVQSQVLVQPQTLEQSQVLVQPQTLEQPQTFVQPQTFEQLQTPVQPQTLEQPQTPVQPQT